jgi:hypothetical protein
MTIPSPIAHRAAAKTSAASGTPSSALAAPLPTSVREPPPLLQRNHPAAAAPAAAPPAAAATSSIFTSEPNTPGTAGFQAGIGPAWDRRLPSRNRTSLGPPASKPAPRCASSSQLLRTKQPSHPWERRLPAGTGVLVSSNSRSRTRSLSVP